MENWVSAIGQLRAERTRAPNEPGVRGGRPPFRPNFAGEKPGAAARLGRIWALVSGRIDLPKLLGLHVMTVRLHRGDLPDLSRYTSSVAIDTETMGLNPHRDRLCVVQLSNGDGSADVVQIPKDHTDAPHLKALLGDPKIIKIFHFARFDIATLYNTLGVMPQPVYCTKIASRLSRTYTDRHGLKDLVRELLNVDLSKQQQSSDWGSDQLSEAQLAYAASDVLHLHALRERLDAMLAREGRLPLAQACFDFLPTRAKLDLQGWEAEDIFAHS
jgi:ribonuclease D